MVKRRKVLAGAASLIAGGAAATGTGAFNDATLRNRSVEYKLDSDGKNSFVGVITDDNPDVENDGYVQFDGSPPSNLIIGLDNFDGPGGLNRQSTFFIDNVFGIFVNKNKAPDTADKYSVSINSRAPGFSFYRGASQNTPLSGAEIEPISDGAAQNSGNSNVVLVGIRVNTANLPDKGAGQKSAGTFSISVEDV